MMSDLELVGLGILIGVVVLVLLLVYEAVRNWWWYR